MAEKMATLLGRRDLLLKALPKPTSKKVMKTNLANLNRGEVSRAIGMAWEDRCTFEHIEETTGLTESEVIQLMRRELKPGSFKRWRKRVSGRKTKHRKLLKAHLRPKIPSDP